MLRFTRGDCSDAKKMQVQQCRGAEQIQSRFRSAEEVQQCRGVQKCRCSCRQGAGAECRQARCRCRVQIEVVHMRRGSEVQRGAQLHGHGDGHWLSICISICISICMGIDEMTQMNMTASFFGGKIRDPDEFLPVTQ